VHFALIHVLMRVADHAPARSHFAWTDLFQSVIPSSATHAFDTRPGLELSQFTLSNLTSKTRTPELTMSKPATPKPGWPRFS
jgi:hypothetical protein